MTKSWFKKWISGTPCKHKERSNETITRFACNKGFLNLEDCRISINNWLFSKKNNGKFYVYIDDIADSVWKRSRLVEHLFWLGIKCEIRTRVNNIRYYREVTKTLIQLGDAYPCDEPHEQHGKNRNLNPVTCLTMLDEPKKLPIRLKLPEKISFITAPSGKVVISLEKFADPVILNNAGIPTAEYATVLDDLDVQLSHLIYPRRPENNYIGPVIYDCFGLSYPIYIPMSSWSNCDKQELDYYKNSLNISAEAMFSFALQAHSTKMETYTKDELINKFEIDFISQPKADIIDLKELNIRYFKKLPVDVKVQLCLEELQKTGNLPSMLSFQDYGKFVRLLEICKSHITKPIDVHQYSWVLNDRYFFTHPRLVSFEIKPVLKKLIDILQGMTDPVWTPQNIERACSYIIQFEKVSDNNLRTAITAALSGKSSSVNDVDLFSVIHLMGKADVTRRIQAVCA